MTWCVRTRDARYRTIRRNAFWCALATGLSLIRHGGPPLSVARSHSLLSTCPCGWIRKAMCTPWTLDPERRSIDCAPRRRPRLAATTVPATTLRPAGKNAKPAEATEEFYGLPMSTRRPILQRQSSRIPAADRGAHAPAHAPRSRVVAPPGWSVGRQVRVGLTAVARPAPRNRGRQYA